MRVGCSKELTVMHKKSLGTAASSFMAIHGELMEEDMYVTLLFGPFESITVEITDSDDGLGPIARYHRTVKKNAEKN